MAGRKSDFTLPTNTLDELFSTQEERDDAKLSKIRDIPLELIDDFPDHPFKVRDDEDMMQLVESVKERGVITPATVRQKEDGRYRVFKDGASETQMENLRDKIYHGKATRADITRLTRRLGDEIAAVYGFDILKQQTPQERGAR